MKYTIKSGSGIEEGKHAGRVIDMSEVERGQQKFKYLEFLIRLEGSDQEVKFSCPAPKGTLNPKSKLGEILSNFVKLEEDGEIDPEQVLVNQEVTFQTIDNKNGYAEVVEGSVKPKPKA
jgi:hypothetical protein